MPTSEISWEVTEASSKFGFGDGDGPNFTDEVVAAIEAAGVYRCQTQVWGLHNYAIERIDQLGRTGAWTTVAEFDGYALPPWTSLPHAIRAALVALNDGAVIDWRL